MLNKGEGSMGKVKVNTLKVKREAELEEEAVKFKMSWPGQSSGWGPSWAGGWTRGHPEPQPQSDSIILSLICTTARKKQIFWTSGLTGRFWAMMFQVTYLKWLIPILFVLFHHLQWLVAEYLCCIYVMALAQARKSLRLVELFPSEAL